MGQQCCHSPPSGHETVQSGGWRGKDEPQKSTAGTSPTGAAPPLDTQDETWEISRSDLEFMKTTGIDYLGTSWKGKWKDAVEVEIRTVALDKEGARECLEEAEFLRGLRHPHLLNVVGVCTEGRQVHVVTELPFSASVLQHWLRRGGQVGLPLHLHLLSQVASGLAYLEEHDLLYLELTVRNILMTSDLLCKLQVCGLVRRCQDVDIADMPLSFTRMAPEVLMIGSISMKSSVWAFGVFMLEMVKSGQLDIHEYMNNQDVMRKLKKGHGFPPPDNCPQDLYELMKKCWVLRPEKRPTFASLRDSLQNDAAGYSREDLEMCLEAS